MALAFQGLDGVASTRLGHALHLVANSLYSFSEKRRKDAVKRSWGSTNELVGMLNKEYPPCLEAQFRDDVESVVSAIFSQQQCFVQLTRE